MHPPSLFNLIESANNSYLLLVQKTPQLEKNSPLLQTISLIKASLDQINQISSELEQEESDPELKEFFSNHDHNSLQRRPQLVGKADHGKRQGEIKIKREGEMEMEMELEVEVEVEGADSRGEGGRRGPYRQYTEQTKENVLQLFRQGNTFNRIAKVLGIPSKNVIRWCRNGVHRKPGAGRKVLDPEMEEKLYEWIRENYQMGSQIEIAQIRIKAKQLSKSPGFFASLGWLKNFSKRYSLKQKFSLQ